MNTAEPIVLLRRDGFEFIKKRKNQYSLFFSMTNKNIVLSKILDFNLVKLIYDLNTDIYVHVNLEKVDENKAIITLLMKHLFEDLGLPQRFSYVNVERTVIGNKTLFSGASIKTHRPPNVPDDSELAAIKNMNIECTSLDDHNVTFKVDINFEEYITIPPFAEKMINVIINKIFIRVKQFIENIRIE